MVLSWNVETECPQCQGNDNVWMFEKQEGAGIKECYTCDECGAEWSEMRG